MLEELLQKAQQGDADAMYRLGRMYQFGTDGVEVDYEKAYSYYSRGAMLGHVEAMISTGDALTLGRGCKKDPDTGASYYQEAYEAGKKIR